jgi:hypothetical protein
MTSSPPKSPNGRTAVTVVGTTEDKSSSSAGAASAAAVAAAAAVEESDRDRAIREAQECLQAVDLEGYALDGFNLLGVVANPRSMGMMGSSTPTPSTHRHISSEGISSTDSPQHPQPQQATPTSSSDGAAPQDQPPPPPPEPDTYFTEAVHSLGDTLTQVTEQIEVLNMFLGELSREYLGDDGGESLFLEYYYQDREDEQPPPIPPQLANLELSQLQSYLEQCGILAHSLFAQGLENPSHNISVEDLEQELLTIPSLFYEPDFDLTQSVTFVQLLMEEDNNDDNDADNDAAPTTTTILKKGHESSASAAISNHHNHTAATKRQTTPHTSLYQPTHELVPLKEPDSYAGHLDRVELALQEQVRQKSGAFFQETTRFRQLQRSIEELLDQVQTIRTYIHQLLSVYRQTKDISNHQRQDYEQLVDLMDTAMELITCKTSVGGLLSANDHLGAAQQIQYGRRLLKGGSFQDNMTRTIHGNGNRIGIGIGDGTTTTPSIDNNNNTQTQLQQLTALSTCGEQFKQYESLVVQNLSEEMVDVFFHWRNTEKERVQEMVQALNLCQALSKTGELYQRRLQQTIRMTVRTTIAEFVESSGTGGSGVTGMTYSDFYNCLELLIEELMSVLKMARRVDEFCETEHIFHTDTDTDTDTTDNSTTTTNNNTTTSTTTNKQRWTKQAMATAADLAAKSIAELLRLRKEAHSLITLEEMKQLWDTCLEFTLTVEDFGNTRAVGLRSTLVGQAKAFLDRAHESNMAALVAALDSERWTQCEVGAAATTTN